VGPRTGLDNVEMRKILPLPGLELEPLQPVPVAILIALFQLSLNINKYRNTSHSRQIMFASLN
jgi:hypothetical protein